MLTHTLVAWPPPDHKARDFLEVVAGLEEARARHLAFFIAMFQCASSRIKSFSDKVYEDEESLAKDWKAYLDADDRHARRQYFDDVVKVSNIPKEACQTSYRTPSNLRTLCAGSKRDDGRYSNWQLSRAKSSAGATPSRTESQGAGAVARPCPGDREPSKRRFQTSRGRSACLR